MTDAGTRLTDFDRGILAEFFEVAHEAVEADAAEIAGWQGSADELHALIRQRHGFPAKLAYRYQTAVRRALDRSTTGR